jgi:hypothetical protein
VSFAALVELKSLLERAAESARIAAELKTLAGAVAREAAQEMLGTAQLEVVPAVRRRT